MKTVVVGQAVKQTATARRRASVPMGRTGGAPPRSNQIARRLLRHPGDGETVRLRRQAGGGVSCSPPAECPSDFCAPFPARFLAVAARDASAPVQDLSGQFGSHLSNSATTSSTTDFLAGELKTSLEASLPSFPPGVTTVTVDIPSRIGPAIAEIGNQNSAHLMDFNVIGEIPGNIAGGIGDNRQAPDTSSAILGSYPRGTTITIECQTTGNNVGGNAAWDRTDRGYVSDRYVLRGAGTPPNC
ncbi:MAG: SH3 domain-containing protein [Bryobacterales bacterium]|nr:SH3 domain-containing protein [Bryobacterales bacterium]